MDTTTIVDKIDKWAKDHGIDPENDPISAEQAQDLLNRIRNSTDPRIKDYLDNILKKIKDPEKFSRYPKEKPPEPSTPNDPHPAPNPGTGEAPDIGAPVPKPSLPPAPPPSLPSSPPPSPLIPPSWFDWIPDPFPIWILPYDLVIPPTHTTSRGSAVQMS